MFKKKLEKGTFLLSQEKYDTKVIADTASEGTPYFIFGAISKARLVAPFWFEVSSMSLPQV